MKPGRIYIKSIINSQIEITSFMANLESVNTKITFIGQKYL